MLTASWTTANLESVIRRSVLERALRDGGLGYYGTATGGSTSTIIDTTKLKSTQYEDDLHVGSWARVSYDGGGSGAAPEGEISPITDSVASTGTLTVNPALSAAVASTDKYQIWRNIHPQDALDTLDQILTEECYLPDWTLLTEVPDGDMEQNNTTDWEAGAGTFTKVSTEPAMWGRRWGQLVNSGANDYVQNANKLRVIPGKRYHVSALSRGFDTTMKLMAYDNSHHAEIESVTHSNEAIVRLHMEITIPSGCYDLRVRMGSANNNDTTFWDEVCVYALDTARLPLPFWVKNKQQVKGIFSPVFDQLGTGIWAEWPRLKIDENRWDFLPSGFGRGQTGILRRDSGELRPTYIFGTRPETAYANENTETKRLDANFINAALLFHLYDQMAVLPNAGNQNMEHVERQRAKWEREYKIQKRKQEERLAEIMQTATPDAYIYSDSIWRNERPLVN